MDKLGLFFKLGATIVLAAVATASIVYWFTLSPRESASSQVLPTPTPVTVAAATESVPKRADMVVSSTPTKPAVEIHAPAGITPAVAVHTGTDSPDPSQIPQPLTTADESGSTSPDGKAANLNTGDTGPGAATPGQNTPLPVATTSLFESVVVAEEPRSFSGEPSPTASLTAGPTVMSLPIVPLIGGSSVVTITPQAVPHTPVSAPEVGERAAAAIASAGPRTDATARPISPVSTPTPLRVLPGGSGSDTPTPLLPFLVEDGAIYRGPDGLGEPSAILPAGQMVDIVARDTTGGWYLLANGYWIATTSVANVPPILPLVVPTPTPTITPTGLPTDTPTPLPVDEPSPTPSPIPTSLDVVICDCSEDQYECLGSYFATQAHAQLCFEYCFRQTGRDIHELDLDGNGRACENLD